MIIKDGKGTGKTVEVDNENRLHVQSDTRSFIADISDKFGDAYVFSHGDYLSITTTNTETGILHVKNTSSTKKLYVESIRTCGDVINKWKLYKSSTGGTLISDQTAGNSQNMNVTSGNTADVTVYKGAEGKTVTGGSMLGHLINDVGHSNERFDGALILGRNDSIELSVEVPSAGEVCCRVIGYYA